MGLGEPGEQSDKLHGWGPLRTWVLRRLNLHHIELQCSLSSLYLAYVGVAVF